MAILGSGSMGPTRGVVRQITLVLIGVASACSSSRGQQDFMPARASTKVYFDTSHTADALLRSADNHGKAGSYAEAVDIYQRVIQQFGDKVVDVPPDPGAGEGDSRLSVNARRECQRRIAALPEEARALYRARVDAQAERWYRQGAASRDRSTLRRVVDQAFCSSWGDDALELLGDLAFQDGAFAEAMSAYVQLLPDRPDGRALVHPDPSVDLSRIAAKKILCRAAIGEHPPTEAEIAAFGTEYPKATGPFAGRRGPLAADLAEAIRDDRLAPSAESDGRWPTFAGSTARNKIAPGSIDVGSLQWRVELDPIEPMRGRNSRYAARMNTGASQIPPERLLAYHPIVVGDQVIVDDDKQITAYNLNSRPGEQFGATTTPVEVAWKTPDLMGTPAAMRGLPGLARYTLTAFGDRIYARIGQPPSSTPTMNRMGIGMGVASTSFVVAVSRSAQGHLLWKREASEIALPKRQAEGGSRNAVFEGSPVADEHNVYIAITDRIEMTASYVACLDAETGATRWVRYICEANANVDPFLGGSLEVGHRLLTLDGPTIYYQTNLGAVASIDAETGGIRWLATYPWQGRNAMGPGRERDLNPAIVHDGLVIVAPDDAPEIYAFDAATGRLIWKTEPIPEDVKLAHILGVAKGKLVATGDRVLWFDVKDGKLAHTWPDNSQAGQGFGRGILAGDKVYWPTRTEIHVLDQASGLKAEPPIKLQETYQCEGGNLAAGDGFLIVATTNALVVFCQNSRLIDRYRDEIARAPEQALNYYRLAQAAEAIGRDEVALASLEMALPRARPSETIDGVPLGEATRDHQQRLLMKLGQKARAVKDWAEATRRFEGAALAARSDRDRLSARLELADAQVSKGEEKASVATLQALLGDERLRALDVDAADGHRSVRADLLIADRLGELLREKGRELYADFDREASELLARGLKENSPRLLEDIARIYPTARVVPESLLALGELYTRTDRPGDAARTYKRLLTVAPDDARRARALWGLAHAYEEQKLWVSARDTYLQASKRFGDESIDEPGGAEPLETLVASRLAREPFDRMIGNGSEPNLPVPLRRRWDLRWPETSRPIAAEGVPPSAEAGRVFLARGHVIRPVDPASGRSAWSSDLEGDPIWVGYLADRIIAATKTRLVALSLETGAVEWRYDLGVGTTNKGAGNPFARDPAAEGIRAGAQDSLRDFRIVGNRVFCLQGDKTLKAFDGDSGLLDWSYEPKAERINPHLIVGPRRIVLQVRKPNAVLVLDTESGRRRSEFPQAEQGEWPRDPLPIDEDHIAVVANTTTVALFDITRGVNAWIFQETPDFPKYGPPRLFGDAERLLVLQDGHELIRLDPASGAKRWSRLLGTEDLSDRPESVVLAEESVFVTNGPTLSSIAMDDGLVLWKRPLNGPESRWSLALTERCVAAYPNPSGSDNDNLSALPLIFHRRLDGEPIQRLFFQAPVSDLTIRFSPQGALVATQAGLWALGDQQQVMDVARGPR
ncbi:PQQ-binding-like beta-propeller repeat protein [Tundrisphaera lichenicola]|uniref:outer membrane protein assembly factor BamB family protein n=1 Tax=Tundrisphaera lichenicola TaxID=2029860 RepID=UPI003EB9E7AA